jgi:AraC family transcriptional regulator, regulatory protein of adaptative response / methylated-DNA-[protein]-cysteine methyltransferase
MPENEYPTNYYRIASAIEYLEKNIHRQPELHEVADHVHLSPFHFQRMFSEWAGISPKRFLQFLTTDYLKKKLQQTRSLAELAETAGLSGQSRVYDLFTTLEAVTPQEYKEKGAGLRLEYGFHETPFGECLIGITGRGICWLSFLQANQTQHAAMKEMQAHWYLAEVQNNPTATQTYMDELFPGKALPKKIHLVVKGTNFQVKVWEALLKIPAGDVTTYQDIAQHIHHPRAMQAVGSAVGSNHIAYLIPCHRVIRKDGILGEYRWDALRKKSMIGWEMAAAECGTRH